MDDNQFKELCASMKVGKSLSYQDFLEHFQRQNNAEYTENMQTTWVRNRLIIRPNLGGPFKYNNNI